jgi:membrane fusion protein, multidrug efflux system
MKRKIITIVLCLLVTGSIGIVLANNKAKIDKAAKPVKEHAVIPVKAAKAKLDSFNASFTINGATVPAREVAIASEVQGKLVGLYIENGDFVRAGQVIATLDASVYTAQLKSIQASIAKAALDLQRYSRLVELGGATPMQVENVQLQYNSLLAEKEQILEQISHMQIRSPFHGKVENVSVEKGSFVSFGTVLGRLIDNSSLKVNVFLSEQEAVKVKKGQQVTISSVVLTKARFGQVTMMSDRADASGKFMAEVTFDNAGSNTFKAGVLADVSFPMTAETTGVSIPVSALVGSTSDAKVYLVRNNRAEIKTIKTGIVTSEKVQVLDGLQPGDQVVVSGQLNLEHGSPISIIK